MTAQTQRKNQSRKIEHEARVAVAGGVNIHETVRDITLKALSTGHLDVQKSQEVVKAVLEGASLGAKEKGARVDHALREVMTGVDEALAKSAEASKLAIEEAAGHIKEFGSQNLQRGLNDLRTLEDMFLESANDIARASDDTVRNVLGDLVQHARNTGTAVGAAAKKAVETLTRQQEENMRENVSVGADMAREVGIKISMAAAGFLEGIAETLKKKGTNKKE